MARRAAEVVALRDLTRKVQGSIVSPDGRTEWVSGLVQGHRFLEPTVGADGSVRIVAQITLDQLGTNYEQLWLQCQDGTARATTLAATLAQCQAQLAALQQTNAQLAAENDALRAQQAAAAAEKVNLQQQIVHLQAQMAAQQQQIAAQMQAVAQQMAAMQAAIAQQQATIAQQQATIDQLRTPQPPAP